MERTKKEISLDNKKELTDHEMIKALYDKIIRYSSYITLNNFSASYFNQFLGNNNAV